jgi:hypothetical protein
MEITKEELNKRLGSSKNLINSLSLTDTPKSNVVVMEPKEAPYTKPIESVELRTLAGSLAHFDSIDNVAESLSLTKQQVITSKNSTNGELKKRVKDTVDEVSELALSKLMDALGLLRVESMMDLKAVDISKIASNLSRVHSNVKKVDQGSTSPMFVIHAPVQNNINHYETVSI